MSVLNFAVISASGMARTHMSAIASNPASRLAAICDIDAERLAEAAQQFGVTRTAVDYREVAAMEDVDAVIVCTPDQTHREITEAMLDAGKHVLCEKPMALTLEDCRAMVEASRKAKTKLMIGQICRYTPGFYEAKRMIDAGEIGELFFVETEYAHDYAKITGTNNWRLDPLRHGFLGGGCHAVDLARWVAGNPYEVTAYSNHKMLDNYPTDDCTIAIFRFPNDVIGKVFVSTGCKRGYTMRSCFYGSKGTIITDNTNSFMTVFKTDSTCGPTVPMQYPVSIANHNTVGEIGEFIETIANDLPVKTDALEGAATVAASLAAVKSTKSGLPEKIDYNF